MYKQYPHKFLNILFENGKFNLSILPKNDKYYNTIYRFYKIKRQKTTSNFLFITNKTDTYITYNDIGWGDINEEINQLLSTNELYYKMNGRYRSTGTEKNWFFTNNFEDSLCYVLDIEDILSLGTFNNLSTITFSDKLETQLVKISRHSTPNLQNIVFESGSEIYTIFHTTLSLNFIFERGSKFDTFIYRNNRRNNFLFKNNPEKNIINNKSNYPGTNHYPLKSFIGETDTDKIECGGLVEMCVTEMMMLMDRKVNFSGKTYITYNDDRDLKYINRFLKKQKINDHELIKTDYKPNSHCPDFYNVNINHHIKQHRDPLIVLGHKRFNLTIKPAFDTDYLHWKDIEWFFLTHIDSFINGFTLKDQTPNNIFREFCTKSNNVKLINKINEKYYQS